MYSIPLTGRLSKIAEQLKCEGDAESLAGKLVRLGAKRLIQELLEAEATEYLGRERYERSDGEEGRRGYRNGHKARRLDSAEGRLHIDVPQVSDSDKPFRMGLGNKESYEDWLEHFRDVTRRGLKIPLTVTTDGAPGLIKAMEAMWPEAERIRCWVHKMRNVLDKVPEEARAVLKPYLEAVRDAPDYETGKAMARVVIERFGDEYPSAMRSFEDDLDASLAHLKLPHVHRRSVRTTNLVERSFEEERRRAKVLPRFRTEKECLKLVYATLWRASERWRRVRFTEHERRQLERYVEERQTRRDREDSASTSTVA